MSKFYRQVGPSLDQMARAAGKVDDAPPRPDPESSMQPKRGDPWGAHHSIRQNPITQHMHQLAKGAKKPTLQEAKARQQWHQDLAEMGVDPGRIH